MANHEFNVSSTKLIWEVDNFTPEMLRNHQFHYVKSGIFYMKEQFPPYGLSKWSLQLEHARTSVVCYLIRQSESGSEPSIASVSYEMALLDYFGQKEKKIKGVTMEHHGYGPNYFRLDRLINARQLTEHKEMLLKDKKLTIVVELELLSSCSVTYLPQISEQFENLFNSEAFSDFTLVLSDGQKVPVHKNILSTRSPVFKTMMETNMLENEKSKCTVEDIEARVMLEFIRFVYCGRVEKIEEIAQGLLYAASKYDIPGLKKLCSSSLALHLSIENVLETIVFADLHQENRLTSFCMKFILKHYNKISKSEGWKDFPQSILKELLDQAMQKKEEQPMKLTSSLTLPAWAINRAPQAAAAAVANVNNV